MQLAQDNDDGTSINLEIGSEEKSKNKKSRGIRGSTIGGWKKS